MATATPVRPKSKTRDNKITRLILPALFDAPGSTIKDVIDPRTGKAVEALYFYDAQRAGQIEQYDEPVRSGKRGRPAKRWKLTKNTRDKVRRARAKAEKAAA
jgi:hypothetical protein